MYPQLYRQEVGRRYQVVARVETIKLNSCIADCCNPPQPSSNIVLRCLFKHQYTLKTLPLNAVYEVNQPVVQITMQRRMLAED